jgi:hypothetical protein
MKIEAAAEVASGEDSAVTKRVMSRRIVKTGSRSRLTVL